MKTILIDPFPREMELIFTKEKLRLLKKNFNLINAPKKNKLKFYEKYISKADFIIGQPNLQTNILKKAKIFLHSSLAVSVFWRKSQQNLKFWALQSLIFLQISTLKLNNQV